MGLPTLFGDSDEIREPVLRAPESVVRELVSLGVGRATAEGYEHRQAFAVLERLRAARRVPTPGLAAEEEAAGTDRGGSVPERLAAAAVLGEVLSADPQVPADELYRVVRCCLYVLSGGETARVARGLVKILTGEPADGR